ncbi:MAG: Ig-like domain-containing protein, partial [Desulfatiglandales bacterium]
MKKRNPFNERFTIVFALLLGLFVLGASPAFAGNGKAKYVAGELLIQMKVGASKSEVKGALKQCGATTLGEIERIRVKRIKVPAQALEKVKAALSKNPHFSFVENNYLAMGAVNPNDEKFPSQWHLPKISAPAGWDLNVGSEGEPIAIIDSGVDPTHPDLAAKLLTGYNFVGDNTDTHDVLGHGTAVAGSSAAITNNTTGVAGVAWNNPIMPLAVLGADNLASYYDVAAAVIYAVDRGVRVINISLGGPSISYTMQNAVTYAWNHGALVFASAANSNTSTPHYPAACTYAVAVSATTSTDTKASFSNYGDWIDIAAPGSSILTTNRGGGYGSWSGTSFSSPIAAGLAALIWSVDPSLTNAEVLDIMTRNADDLGDPGFDIYFGYGRINVATSLAAASNSLPMPDTTQPEVYITSPTDGKTLTGPITIAVSANDNVSVERVDLSINGTPAASDSEFPYEFYWDTKNDPEGFYELTATAFDAAGNAGLSTATIYLASPLDTEPPVVSILSPANGSEVTGTFTVSVSAEDNTAVDQVDLYVDGKFSGTDGIAPYDFLVDTADLSEGDHVISAVAADTSGNTAESPAVFVTVLGSTSEDTVSPEVAIGLSPAGSVLDGTVVIGVSASDDVGVACVELYMNGTLVHSESSGTLYFSWDTTTSPEGNYILSAQAYDTSGNIGTSPAVTVEVKRTAETPTLPMVVISSPRDGALISNKEVIQVSASDEDGISLIEVYIDGTLIMSR